MCTLFINKRTQFFSPGRIFCFLCCFCECVFIKGFRKSVVVAIRHVWLRDKIYQHNDVVILNMKFNGCSSSIYITMVFKCCVVNCRSNYASKEKPTAFSFLKERHLRKIWIQFANRKN